MTTNACDYQLDLGGTAVDVVQKRIKHLHIGVYPPCGRVRVSAPLRLDREAVRLAVLSRLAWIRRKQAAFAGQERQSEREFVTGESHYFEGHRYRLDVVPAGGRPPVVLANNTVMSLRIRPGADRAEREAVLDRWYRRELRARLPALLEKWEARIGVQAAVVRIRKMKTRWGSCNTRTGDISLNLELMKKPASCLEYVLVHELVHLIERSHNARFRQLMDRHLPQWRAQRDLLNRAPLTHSRWE